MHRLLEMAGSRSLTLVRSRETGGIDSNPDEGCYHSYDYNSVIIREVTTIPCPSHLVMAVNMRGLKAPSEIDATISLRFKGCDHRMPLLKVFILLSGVYWPRKAKG